MANDTILQLILRTLQEGEGAKETAADLEAMKKQAKEGSEALTKLTTAEDNLARAQKMLRANTDPEKQEQLAQAVTDAQVALAQAKQSVDEFEQGLTASEQATKATADATKYLSVANAEMAQAMLKADDAALTLADAQKALEKNTDPSKEDELARALLDAREEAERTSKAVKDLGDKTKESGDKAEGALSQWAQAQNLKDKFEILMQVVEGVGKAFDLAEERATALGRNDVASNIHDMRVEFQDLGDALLQIPIAGRDFLQWMGDAAVGLKNTSLAAQAAIIWAEKQTGAIDEQTAAQQIAVLVTTNAKLTTEQLVQAQRDLADPLDETNRLLRAQGDAAAAEATHAADLAKAQQLLAAGLSGAVGNAQKSYAETTADTSKEIEKLQTEIDKYRKLNGQTVSVTKEATVSQAEYELVLRDVDRAQKALSDNTDPTKVLDLTVAFEHAQEKAKGAAEGLGGVSSVTLDYSSKLTELNGQLDEQVAKQDAAAEATRRSIEQFIFQQAAASLDAAGQLELAFKLHMIDEASYNAAKAVQTLTGVYDENGDGTVGAGEDQKAYIEGLDKLSNAIGEKATPAANKNKKATEDVGKAAGTTATTLNNQATPAVRNNQKALEDADQMAGGLATTLNQRGTPAVNTFQESANRATTSLSTAKLTGAELAEIIDRFHNETFTYTFNWVNNGAPPDDGGHPGASAPTSSSPAGTGGVTFTPTATGAVSTLAANTYYITVDARGATDPAATETAAERGAQRALAAAGRAADVRRRV